MDYREIISDVCIYGLESSIRASKYPMIVDIDKATPEVTKRTKSLASAPKGSGHDNFLKGIIVQFDLKMTPKMSVEMERYHFIDFVSSQSTMHRITKFDLDKAYIKYVDKRIIEIMKEKVRLYNELDDKNTEYAKKLYLEILYSQRKTHRLPEWRAFCEWVEGLPFAGDFIINTRGVEEDY